MRLQWYKDANDGSLVHVHATEGNDKPFVPGDLITHLQDRKSHGFVISVVDLQNVLVLWSRPPFVQQETNPCSEVLLDAQRFIECSYVVSPPNPSTLIKRILTI